MLPTLVRTCHDIHGDAELRDHRARRSAEGGQDEFGTETEL